MDNLHFNININGDTVLDISQIQLSIDYTIKKLSDELNRSFSPVLNNSTEQVLANLSTILENSLVKPINELKSRINISPEVIKNIQKALNNCVKDLNISQSEKEFVVDFSDEQLEVLEASNVSIDNYANSERSNKNSKAMSRKAIFTLIALIITIIEFSSNLISLGTAVVENDTATINNDTAYTEYQTAILNNDTAKIQSQSQNEQIDKLAEIANKLIDKCNESTADEITSD